MTAESVAVADSLPLMASAVLEAAPLSVAGGAVSVVRVVAGGGGGREVVSLVPGATGAVGTLEVDSGLAVLSPSAGAVVVDCRVLVVSTVVAVPYVGTEAAPVGPVGRDCELSVLTEPAGVTGNEGPDVGDAGGEEPGARELGNVEGGKVKGLSSVYAERNTLRALRLGEEVYVAAADSSTMSALEDPDELDEGESGSHSLATQSDGMTVETSVTVTVGLLVHLDTSLLLSYLSSMGSQQLIVI